ncbi:MAG: Crp/Fnr family transcriptional regulator [Bacteroidales bacterium]|nr:Crp/Fnr family transcriptional regulator [Bacteroidales bacterium]
MKEKGNKIRNKQEGTNELLNFLKGFPMLTEEEMQLIVEDTSIQSFKKGTILLHEGQIATECYLVLKGCVREYYIVDGEEKSTAFYTEGQPVASFTSASTHTPSKHYLECTEECILTVSDQDLEKEMIAKIPRLESIIRKEVEKNSGKERDDFTRFITSSPEDRYLFLLENRPALLSRIPQHQIASYIGVKPESLSRIRKRMVEKMKKNQSNP